LRVAILETFLFYGYWVATAAVVVFNVMASVHVVLYNRDSRSALGWVGVIWFAPYVGALLYFLLGINRIRRKAHRLRGRRFVAGGSPSVHLAPVDALLANVAPEAAHLAPLVHLAGVVTRQPLEQGNKVVPLHTGDQAYPVMLQAIEEAKQSITLSTYIFSNDRAGGLFVAALGKAVARGVEVRVLIDSIGGHHTWHAAFGPLRAAGVPIAHFLPKLLPRYFLYENMCNHRKLMVVDGRIGFTGGMNVSEGNCLALAPPEPIQDLHFRIDGPAVARLQDVFAEDWEFATGEELQGERWFPEIAAGGSIPARGISSGPDQDLEKLRLVLLGALACAHSHVHIMTPYFLPDIGLISALNITALRGVRVDILVPKQSDHRYVQWAQMGQITELVEHGCRVWLTPPPFTHTKLMLVDGVWTLLGSANWDPRSLSLNFEFNLECYDRALAGTLEAAVQHTISQSQALTLADLNRRPFLVKLRDGIARLLTPYL
jgi:cardiolipin synthase A/B